MPPDPAIPKGYRRGHGPLPQSEGAIGHCLWEGAMPPTRPSPRATVAGMPPSHARQAAPLSGRRSTALPDRDSSHIT